MMYRRRAAFPRSIRQHFRSLSLTWVPKCRVPMRSWGNLTGDAGEATDRGTMAGANCARKAAAVLVKVDAKYLFLVMPMKSQRANS
jgi:hypothetical protein